MGKLVAINVLYSLDIQSSLRIYNDNNNVRDSQCPHEAETETEQLKQRGLDSAKKACASSKFE